MPRCCEIDSEDDAWQGVIDPSVFQQVRDQQEKQRIVAKLEAQNRPSRPGEVGNSSGSGYAVHSGPDSSASSKEGRGYGESAKKLPLGKWVVVKPDP